MKITKFNWNKWRIGFGIITFTSSFALIACSNDQYNNDGNYIVKKIPINKNVSIISSMHINGRILPNDFIIPSWITRINYKAFKEATLPMNFKIPQTVSMIEFNSFESAKFTKEFKTNDYWTYIGLKNGGYEDYANILGNDFSIPPSVTSIPRGAFEKTILPLKFKIPSWIKRVSSKSFSKSRVTSKNFLIPKEINDIKEDAFEGIEFPINFKTNDYSTYIGLKNGGYVGYANILEKNFHFINH